MRSPRWPIVFAFAAVLSACGGGGAGTSTVPTLVGGGPPPHATSTPGATPTPNATPTQLATPTPIPTFPGSGITILPDTTGRFGLTQVLDWTGAQGGPQLSQSQIQSEAPNYDSVWGAFSPSTWNAAHSNMIVSRYFLPNEDSFPMSGHNLAWWQANHPDWVLYACDSNNAPTQDVTWYGTAFHDVPLNIHNQAVVNYQVHLAGSFLVANGYNTLAIDNVIFENYGESPNPDLGEGSPQKGWYGCGIYTQPNFQGFQQIYSGGLDATDPTWIADMKNWIATARSVFNSDPSLAPYHLKILINHPLFDSIPDSDETAVLSNVDGLVDENGFTHYDDYEAAGYDTSVLFEQTLSWMEWAQNHHTAILLTDYFCKDGHAATGQTCSSDPSSLSAKQVDWALSTYAVGNNGGSDVYISPAGGATYSYRSEYATRLGAPCGVYAQANGVYYRKFANALVVVNPNQGTPANFALPANHSYSDIEGRAVPAGGSTLTLNGPDGYVLMTRNGCS